MKNKNLDGNETGNSLWAWSQRERKLAAATVISTCTLLFLLIFGKTWEQRVKVSAAQTVTSQAVVVDGMQAALVDTVRDQALAQTQIADLQDRSQIALARQLATQAQLLFATDDSESMLSTMLAVESMKINSSADAAKVLLGNDLVYPITQFGQINYSQIVEFSVDGKYVISAGHFENILHVWEIDTGRIVAEMSHNYYLRDVAVSPDGRYVASGCEDGTVWIWELRSGRLVSQAVHGGVVTRVLFSPDAKFVISSSDDKTAVIWEVKTGTEFARMSSERYIPSVFFDTDGKYLIHNASDIKGSLSGLNVKQVFLDLPFESVSSDGRYALSHECSNSTQRCRNLSVWDTFTGKKIEAFEQVFFSRGVFSPDSRYVALFDDNDKFLHFWELASRKEVSRVQADGAIDVLTFSNDGDYVAFNFNNHSNVVQIFETKNWTRIGRVKHHFTQYPEMVYHVHFSPDGQYLVTGGTDFSMHVWEIDGQLDVVRINHGAEITNFSLSADNNYAATASKDGVVRIWNVVTGGEVTNLLRSVEVAAVALNSNGNLLAISRWDGTFHVWDVKARESILDYSTQPPIDMVSFSLDNNYILAVGGNTIHLWRMEDGSEVGWFPENIQVRYAVFSPDSQYVLTAGADDIIRVWDIKLGKEINRINYGYSLSRLYLAPTASGMYLVATGGTDTVIWDYVSGVEVIRTSYSSQVSSVIFSSDGKYAFLLAGIIHVVEVATGREVGVISVDTVITAINISPDDKYIIGLNPYMYSSSYVWSMDSLKLVAQRGFNPRVSFVGFTRGGKHALTVTNEDIYIWRYRPEDLIADACSRATRNLTRAEWSHYIGDILPYQATCPNLPIEQ